MEHRAVGNRCAVNLEELGLPFSQIVALDILTDLGFKILEIDLVALARERIGISTYQRGIAAHEAPQIVDCSSFIKWLYAERGIWLPRRSIQQRELGEIVNLDQILPGDVIFTSGAQNYFHNDPADGVGHVGLATGQDTVIHAASRELGVVESELGSFVGNSFRGARRYISKDLKVLTLESPPQQNCGNS
ncbi:MAG TPA: NlpC/P60 family protein [Patescibacteria group bacterium]|nr:NlpC/P60 family protein [Patescibacteria group bacterium]